MNVLLSSFRQRGAWLLVFTGTLALAACGQGESGQGQGTGPGGGFPPAPVTYIELKPERVRIEQDYAGLLQGSRDADVRARVGGIIEARLYDEGAVVSAEAPLFRIEPAPYEIALQGAEADLATARATLAQAQREWRRVDGLFEQSAISARERDQALANRELAEARQAQGEARVAQARLELGYTTVRAPIAGVTGLESLTEGNLVSAGALLTTVTQLDPVHVRFALPPLDAATRRALAQAGDPDVLAATLLLPGGGVYLHRGEVDFAASTADSATGNVMVRAVFPNPDHVLQPGARVRVRLVVRQLEDALLVDETALAQGTSGPVVYVVSEEGTARSRAVQPGPRVNGRQVILEGLSAGDRVIVNGQVAVRDGAPVQPRARDSQAE